MAIATLPAATALAPVTETGTSFVLTSSHANRRVDTTNGSAIAVTWNTGHGMVSGDCGRIVQAGAGAITLSAGTGTLTLAPNVAAAVTTADGSYLDWEYMGGNELLITARGVAASSASVPIKTILPNASPGLPTIAISQTRGKGAVFSIPSMLKDDWLELEWSYQKVSAGAGTTSCDVHINDAGAGALAAGTAVAGAFSTGTGANAGGQGKLIIHGNGTDQTTLFIATVANVPNPYGASLASATFKTVTRNTASPFEITITLTTDATDTAKVFAAKVKHYIPTLSA